MRVKSLFVLVVAACCVWMGLAPSSGGAAPPDSPILQGGISADAEDLVREFSVLRPLVTASREQQPAGAPEPEPQPTFRQSDVCYFEDFVDTIGDALFYDIVRSGLSSNCSEWVFFAETFEVEAIGELDGFGAVVDTDLRGDTGCIGFDIWISGLLDPDFGLVADVFVRPSCDLDDVVRIAEAGFARSTDGSVLGLFVAEELLPSASPFGYAVFTSSIFGDFDQAPNEGEAIPVVSPVPGAPTRVGVQPRDRQIMVQWQAPAVGGAVTYTATASPGGRSCSTDRNGCTITGLRNYTRYRISVVAINGRGSSAAAQSGVVVPRPTRTCAGERVTVDLRAGDRPTRRADVILGTNRSERIRADAGDDLICAGGGRDVVFGGSGDDTIIGGAGNDRLDGGPGNDRIDGGSGTDRCNGGPGRNRIRNCP